MQSSAYDRISTMSVHLARTGVREAFAALRRRPDPAAVDGLRYAEAWLTTPLRTGALPSTKVTGVALLAAWSDDAALDRCRDHPALRVYRKGWTARFEPVRSVGAWPGLADLPRPEQPAGDEPVAVLTMARVRLNRFPAFAAAAGPAEREAVHHPAFLQGTSLLAPPNRVATFSVWRNVRDMRRYTVGHYPGGHARAMKEHHKRAFHHETLFVRLRPYAVEGLWDGQDPLTAPALMTNQDGT
ncbi:MAG TPA: spheroidene monooxygenase [Streptomyces sp.]|nr:spheroidene monooxygenase [Streptomyces sp.]